MTIKPSIIHGYGLFADKDYNKGETICELFKKENELWHETEYSSKVNCAENSEGSNIVPLKNGNIVYAIANQTIPKDTEIIHYYPDWEYDEPMIDKDTDFFSPERLIEAAVSARRDGMSSH